MFKDEVKPTTKFTFDQIKDEIEKQINALADKNKKIMEANINKLKEIYRQEINYYSDEVNLLLNFDMFIENYDELLKYEMSMLITQAVESKDEETANKIA